MQISFILNSFVFFIEKGGKIMKLKYDYCKISPNKDKYIVEYGHNTYKGSILPSPIKVADRAFSTEKKAVRFAKKIVPIECIKKEEK